MRAASLAISSAIVLLVSLLAPGAAVADEELPVPWNLGPGLVQQLQDPDSPPPGANDWSCRPSQAHPNPVVLLHGLLANQTVNWPTFSPLLHNEGYCVFTLTYGMKDGVAIPGYQPGGMIKMEDSAAELAAFVEEVLDVTGAEKVDLLGHSEGTIMPSYYVRFLDGGEHVDKYVSLTPLWEGTTLYGVSVLAALGRAYGFEFGEDLIRTVCESCPQFLQSSDYYKALNAVGMFDPNVTYTNIVTRYDEAVVPYTSGIAPEADNVTNIVLQDQCWQDFSNHSAVAHSPNAAGHVLNALDPDNAQPVGCRWNSPIGGI